MSEVKKLTTEELQTIKDLQSQYNKSAFELGSLEIQINGISKTKELLEQEKELILEDIKKLSEREKDFSIKLQDDYGKGNINIETGEFTSL